MTLTGAPANAKTLVAVPIPSSVNEAYEWFGQCLEEIGKPLAAYEVYFLDANGNRISADGATISIAVSGNKDLTVCSLTTGGDYKDLSAETGNGSAVFTANGGDYFILTERKSDEPGDIPTEPGDIPTEPTTPPTGDNSMIWLWVMIAVISVGMIFFLVFWKRRKEDEEEQNL